jgi:hypothetical protein
MSNMARHSDAHAIRLSLVNSFGPFAIAIPNGRPRELRVLGYLLVVSDTGHITFRNGRVGSAWQMSERRYSGSRT